ncbi:MAG: type II toxin-antitoxin system VapC family toxin [Planctomycetota bacterium]
MNVVDSSAWLEFLADGPNSSFFSATVQDVKHLLVPSITILEVYKRVCQQRDASDALAAIAIMRQGRIIDLSIDLALSAAALGIKYKLPLADSIILATAEANKATVWTMDSDFAEIPGVQYRARKN